MTLVTLSPYPCLQVSSDLLETDMDGFLSGLHMHVDLTLLDRMQLLLSQQPSTRDAGKAWSLHGPSLDGLGRAKHSLYMTASNANTIQQVGNGLVEIG